MKANHRIVATAVFPRPTASGWGKIANLEEHTAVMNYLQREPVKGAMKT